MDRTLHIAAALAALGVGLFLFRRVFASRMAASSPRGQAYLVAGVGCILGAIVIAIT